MAGRISLTHGGQRQAVVGMTTYYVESDGKWYDAQHGMTLVDEGTVAMFLVFGPQS